MKKQSIKNFSDEDILDFYTKYRDKDFQAKLQNIEDKYAKIGITSIKIFFVLGLIGMFISPWCVFIFFPGFIIPTSTLFLSHRKTKKEINKLSPVIKYDDFIHLVETCAFAKIKKQPPMKDEHHESKYVNCSSLNFENNFKKEDENDLTL